MRLDCLQEVTEKTEMNEKLRFLCSLLLEEVSLRKDDLLSRTSRRPSR